MRILSPAKLNLGLSILGKRPDGYHEIYTIMTMIERKNQSTRKGERIDLFYPSTRVLS